jgi:hypothetical protein
MTIRAIQEIVRDLPDPEQENAAVGHISTSCFHSSLRRTEMQTAEVKTKELHRHMIIHEE